MHTLGSLGNLPTIALSAPNHAVESLLRSVEGLVMLRLLEAMHLLTKTPL